MDSELRCNFRKCRKILSSGKAWVTSCSHIFCDDDGEKHLVPQKICPACNHDLKDGDLNIVRINLQLSESYKTMVLIGQKPDVIMDICSRALNFWIFQNNQENLYKEYQINKTNEKLSKLETYCNKITSSMKVENRATSSELALVRKELESSKRRCDELSMMLKEKTKQLQKTQISYTTQSMKNQLSSTANSHHSSCKRPYKGADFQSTAFKENYEAFHLNCGGIVEQTSSQSNELDPAAFFACVSKQNSPVTENPVLKIMR